MKYTRYHLYMQGGENEWRKLLVNEKRNSGKSQGFQARPRFTAISFFIRVTVSPIMDKQ